MKIPLNAGGGQSDRAAQAKLIERDVLAAKHGDWTAKNNLARAFTPLITSLAGKRASEIPEINKRIEAGKEGLFKAVKKYKQSIGADKFQIFAVDFIEAGMDQVNADGEEKGRRGFLSRLFGK